MGNIFSDYFNEIKRRHNNCFYPKRFKTKNITKTSFTNNNKKLSSFHLINSQLEDETKLSFENKEFFIG